MRLIATLLCLLPLLVWTGCSAVPVQPEPSVRAPQPGTVAIYTRPGCPYCRQAMEYLSLRGIAVEVRDISSDRRARQELSSLYGSRLKGERPMVPVLMLGEHLLVGFDEEELAEALATWQPVPQREGP